MVALAVAGVLFMVAMPGYQYAVTRSGRAAARATLLEVMARQEQFFVLRKHYALSLEDLGLPATYRINGQGDIADPASAIYRIELELPDDRYAGVRAVPVNRQVADAACMTFTLSRLGVRSVSGSLAARPGDCW